MSALSLVVLSGCSPMARPSVAPGQQQAWVSFCANWVRDATLTLPLSGVAGQAGLSAGAAASQA
jgi:hypothetical protein